MQAECRGRLRTSKQRRIDDRPSDRRPIGAVRCLTEAMSRRRAFASFIAAIALIGAAAGCAARARTPSITAELGRARSLVEGGCYRCLEEAFGVYEAVAATRNAPAEARRGAFETAVLLTVRARELGLRADTWLERARALGAGLVGGTPTVMDAPPPPVYLDAAMLVAGDASGLPPEEREARTRARRQLRGDPTLRAPARAALSDWVTGHQVAQYLALAIDCEDAQALKTLDRDAVAARHPSSLVAYRLATCGRPFEGARLAALRDADPRWADTLPFEGRYEMSKYPSPDLGRAAELLSLAHDAFPASHAIALDLGNALNALSEHAAALPLFDGILEHVPTHREALLGRVLSLSYLNRYYLAIAAATRLLDLGTYLIGDAYYWRAWNRYQVHDLPDAWTDIEAAAKLMVNTSVYTLAGYIAYAQRELDTAIDRLSRAYKMDTENCDAVWTEGLVHVDKEDWPLAAGRFGVSMHCFAADVTRARGEMRAIESSTWNEAVKTRRLAAARKRADTSEHRRAQSAYNAAGAHARLRQKTEALTYLEIAAEHPLMHDKAAALKASIDKLP